MMSVSYTLLTVIVVVVVAAAAAVALLFAAGRCFSAAAASLSAAVAVVMLLLVVVLVATAAASWVSEPDMGAAALMDRPIFNSRLPSLPVFLSWSRSGGGCDRCNCCSRVYCSCSAFCFFNSSWCRCSNCSCLVVVATVVGAAGDGDGCWMVAAGGSGIGGLPQPLSATVVSDPFRLGGLPPVEDDDTEPLGDDVGAPTALPAVVGEATGDLELVRGGGGGGIRLFCRSGVRSGTGGLPPASEDVLLRRRNTGFGATTIAGLATGTVTAVASAAPVTAIGSTATDSTDSAATAVATDTAAGVVCSSSSRVSSAFSAPVGSRFPALPLLSSVPVPVCSTTLPCPATHPCENHTKPHFNNAQLTAI